MNREPATNNPHRPEPKLTDRGERIVKRYNRPDAIPFDSIVIERGGVRLVRRLDGWHQLYADGTEGAEVWPTDSLAFPVRVVKPKTPGMYLDRRGRREVERVARKAQANLVRARVRRQEVERVGAFLASKGVGPGPFVAEVGPEAVTA